MAHTPGPWTIKSSQPMSISGNVHQITGEGRFPTAFVPAWDKPSPGEIDGTAEALANARLIAAAPALLGALTVLVRRYVELAGSGDCGNWDPELEPQVIAARAAITRATGDA